MAEVFVCSAVSEVSQAECLRYFSRRKEFFELEQGEVRVARGRKIDDTWTSMERYLGEMRVSGLRTFAGMSGARSGMWRSPITRMRKAICVG